MYYRCWAGTKHPAVNIPANSDDDTPLMFHCGCAGSFADVPAVKAARAAGERLGPERVRLLASQFTPPRNPVVRAGDLESD